MHMAYANFRWPDALGDRSTANDVDEMLGSGGYLGVATTEGIRLRHFLMSPS